MSAAKVQPPLTSPQRPDRAHVDLPQRHGRHFNWKNTCTWPTLRAPWVTELVTVAAVLGVVLWQLHPALLFSNTTTTGGDNGGHYITPYYLAHSLLTHGQLTGWFPNWFDGFPIYNFYFLLPDALTALASHVIPYNIAFKLSTVLGSLLLPICALAMGRLFRLKPPLPAALAAFTLPFLFDYTYTIYGGNLFSTLAGEYSFSLSLALALLFLGLFARGLHSTKGRPLTAVVLAACILAHIVPGMYALVGAAILVIFELLPSKIRPGYAPQPDPAKPTEPIITLRRKLWWAFSTLAIAGLLTGFWIVPFGLQLAYSNSMNYAPVRDFVHILLPQADWWVLIIAAISVPIALVRRSRFGIMVSLLGGVSALGVCFDPLASLYNPRFLPLWFISVYLLAGYGLSITLAQINQSFHLHKLAHATAPHQSTGKQLSRKQYRKLSPSYPGVLFGALATLFITVAVVIAPFTLSQRTLTFFHLSKGPDQVSSWAQWNYSGYEAKPGAAEFNALMLLMRKVGDKYGCGQAMWEYSPDLDRFGSTMALMQLPYWTAGCIGSMEGLLAESSATTPYHFLNQAELSTTPSEAQRNLPYTGVNLTLGIQHLQLLGVRYFMASSTTIQALAAQNKALTLVGTTGPWPDVYSSSAPKLTWKVYKISNSARVIPLSYLPAVQQGINPDQSSWLRPSLSWYTHPSRWDVPLAQSGPANWPRVPIGDPSPPKVAVPTTVVTDIYQNSVGDGNGQTITFHVSKLGTPVLVKESYFPNWKAIGATGPYRVTPNLMVVVPTSHNVTLHYGSSPSAKLGDASTILGTLLLLLTALLPLYRRIRRHLALFVNSGNSTDVQHTSPARSAPDSQANFVETTPHINQIDTVQAYPLRQSKYHTHEPGIDSPTSDPPPTQSYRVIPEQNNPIGPAPINTPGKEPLNG